MWRVSIIVDCPSNHQEVTYCIYPLCENIKVTCQYVYTMYLNKNTDKQKDVTIETENEMLCELHLVYFRLSHHPTPLFFLCIVLVNSSLKSLDKEVWEMKHAKKYH